MFKDVSFLYSFIKNGSIKEKYELVYLFRPYKSAACKNTIYGIKKETKKSKVKLD